MCNSSGLKGGGQRLSGLALANFGGRVSNFDFGDISFGSSGGGGGDNGGSGLSTSGGLSGLGSVFTNSGAGGGTGGDDNGQVSVSGTLSSIGSSTLSGAKSGGWIGAVGGAITGIWSNMSKVLNNHGKPDHERPDLIKIAAANDITEQEASNVCGFEESHVDDNYDDICARSANDNGYFLGLVAKYNAAHPGSKVISKTVQLTEQYTQLQSKVATALAGSGVASPIANLSLADAQNRAAATGMTLIEWLQATVNGAAQQAQAAKQTASQPQSTLSPVVKSASAMAALGVVAPSTSTTPTTPTNNTKLYVGCGVAALVLVAVVVFLIHQSNK